jgi:multidrug resistance efflux pump
MGQRKKSSLVLSAVVPPTLVALFALAMVWRVTSEGTDDVAHRVAVMPVAFVGLILVCGAIVNLGALVGSLERRIAELEAERANRELGATAREVASTERTADKVR